MTWKLTSLLALIAILVMGTKSPALPTEICIFAIGALGFHVLYGMYGLLSFGHSVFFGGAAYICGLAATHLGLSALPLILLGGGFGLAVAVLFSLLSLRTKGIYFVMLTLTLGQVGYFLALALRQYTGGENGLGDVVRPDLWLPGMKVADLQSPAAFLAYCVVALVAVFIFVERLTQSPLGSVFNSIRQNERRAEALGYNLNKFRLAAFAISGFVTGVAGCLYANFLKFVPLNTTDIETAEKLVIMVIIGGTRSALGPVVGACIFLLMADLLSPIWPRWMMLMGLLLVVAVIALRGRGVADVVTEALANRWSKHRARRTSQRAVS